ncbi:plant/F17O14-7 protein [Senna tora]|uniref:Plant/F17O14-7 protein n=1 Tax=Senna tora TaxID=362788 RepID=A0A835CM44_9FABA|nr:plant/F17O14-7 protein [Senna tora]
MIVIILLCMAQITFVSGSSISEAKALDALLQDYAFRAFVNPKTGVIFDGVVPSHLNGIKIAALRLKSGSLWRRGYEMYKEFEIPMGLVETPSVERLVLVYQNLGNWSTNFYELPNFTCLAPVLGLIAYDGSNLSATNLAALDIRVSGHPILVKFKDVKSAPEGSVAKCVWFDLEGSSDFSNVVNGNTCSISQQGHLSIVVHDFSTAPKRLITVKLIVSTTRASHVSMLKPIQSFVSLKSQLPWEVLVDWKLELQIEQFIPFASTLTKQPAF